MEQKKLNAMLNKTFMYEGREHKILSFNIEEETLTIVTDKRWIKVPVSESNKKLEEFLEIEDEEEFEENNSVAGLIKSSRDEFGSVRQTLLNNLKNIQEGNYEPKKIRDSNSTINTLLNSFKTEIQIVKAIKK